MERENLNSEEAAKFLCVSLSKLMKMCHKKEVKYYKVGRLNIFKKGDLLLYLENHKVFTVEELKKQAEAKAFKNSNYACK